MSDGQRIDWRAIPSRYRRWQGLPLWRKALWLVTRSVTMVVLYVAFAAAILWYNAPATIEGIGAGRESVLSLVGLFGRQPDLLVLCLLLVPAVLAATLLPHRPDWR